MTTIITEVAAVAQRIAAQHDAITDIDPYAEFLAEWGKGKRVPQLWRVIPETPNIVRIEACLGHPFPQKVVMHFLRTDVIAHIADAFEDREILKNRSSRVAMCR